MSGDDDEMSWTNATSSLMDNSGNATDVNSTLLEDEELPPPAAPFTPQFKILSFVLYTTIFLLGMVGNSLFCYVVISSRSMRSVTYKLLVNLSISDLLITCLCGPVHVVYTLIMGFWPFGEFVCYVYSYTQGIFILVSSYTMVVISFERYMSILYPLRSVIRSGYTKYIILALWTMAALVSIPNGTQVAYFNVTETVFVCTTELEEDSFHHYSLAFCIFQYFLPVLFMTYSYLMVAATIWRQQDTIEAQQHSQNSRNTREANMLNGRKKMIKMLIVVVAVYTVCWLPFNIYYVIGLKDESVYQKDSHPYIFTIFHIMAISHTCYNPFIYCWMNIRVRHGFMEVFANCPLVKKCFFWIDWETPRLQRNTFNGSQYHHEQNHYLRRTRSTINGRKNNQIEMIPLQANTSLKSATENGQQESNGKSHEFVSKATVERQPKVSNISNHMDISDLYSQEPLMAATNVLRTQRSHKVSTTSNTTQLTDITMAESSGSEDQVFQQQIPVRSMSRKRRVSSAMVRMETLPENEFQKDDFLKSLKRSVSEEINEQLMTTVNKPNEPKADERYN